MQYKADCNYSKKSGNKSTNSIRIMSNDPKNYVTGNHGMFGSTIVCQLLQRNISPASTVLKCHAALHLTNQTACQAFLKAEPPPEVYAVAVKLGGINPKNTYRADFTYQDLWMRWANLATKPSCVSTPATSASSQSKHCYGTLPNQKPNRVGHLISPHRKCAPRWLHTTCNKPNTTPC